MSKKRFNTETKLLAMQCLEAGQHTIEEICEKFSVSKTTLSISKLYFVVSHNDTKKRSQIMWRKIF